MYRYATNLGMVAKAFLYIIKNLYITCVCLREFLYYLHVLESLNNSNYMR